MGEMRDGASRWYEQLPEHWQLKCIKHCFYIISGATPRSDIADYWDGDVKWITPADYKTEDKYVSGGKRNITRAGYHACSTVMIPAGSIIFTKRAPIGTVAINTERLCTNQGCLSCVRKREDIFVPFFYYAMWMCGEQFQLLGSGTTFREISATVFANVKLPVPPYDIQKRIAGFLDKKCREIDRLSAELREQIDVLEQYNRSVITEKVTKGLDPKVRMRESGVQWLGEIPAHWACIRGKYILKYMQKPVRADDGVVTCFRDGEVTLRSKRREEGFTMADKEIGYQGVDVGDLVVHGMDGFAGAIGISDSRGKASPVLNVLETEQNKRYIMYFLRSMAYQDVFLALATGIRVRSCDLRWNKLSELVYPVPPIAEQNAVVEWIDTELKKTNGVIREKRAQLDTLEAYKKSLIFEYVTGKREAPEQSGLDNGEAE